MVKPIIEASDLSTSLQTFIEENPDASRETQRALIEARRKLSAEFIALWPTPAMKGNPARIVTGTD